MSEVVQLYEKNTICLFFS